MCSNGKKTAILAELVLDHDREAGIQEVDGSPIKAFGDDK
jgi:hypothetical protein